jgi:hypothetical protein
MMLAEPAPSVEAFFQSYRAAFERSDVVGVAGHFAYPSHVTGDAEEVVLMPVATVDEWIGSIEQLLDTYQRIGFASARVVELTALELSQRLYQAMVRWELHDAGGDMLYRFEAAYTLAEIDGALRITALAHNELPRLRSCLARLGH